ncbi:PepSY domain-containing protein [Maridesulfovibrio sp.]|uniref:PepSY domain-containing protein n=1 Tax=Maridesulfovibrio sp. TaxID=2795000 RepID=UPI003BADA956
MDKAIIKELFIVFCAAITVTFGAISAIADDFYSDDYIKSADYIMKSAQHSNCTLAALVGKAEKAAQGIAIEVEIEDEDGQQYVEVDILRQKDIVQVKCSLMTGKILNISEPEFLSSLIEKLCSQYQSTQDKKLSMEEAIRQAEINTCSTAYRAEIENIDGLLCYQIHLFTPQRTIMVMLDPESGRVLSHRDIERRDDDH